MPRRSQFTVDASSVQGNDGAMVTFRRVTVGENDAYLHDDTVNDRTMLEAHLITWSGIVDDDDNPLPDPAENVTAAVDALYIQEKNALMRLLWRGPDEDDVKN